jgi:hypothetical protein
MLARMLPALRCAFGTSVPPPAGGRRRTLAAAAQPLACATHRLKLVRQHIGARRGAIALEFMPVRAPEVSVRTTHPGLLWLGDAIELVQRWGWFPAVR